ncbi:hypothetical protein, conserved [Leishmania tarentolae]|uniref:Flagellar attachment zone protein 1 conserved domain-containing protein n=1 Tax=Leishmania tarentolae TaxID=5689 RepID=A0A640KFR3_LEITA|nr:hypothetical protein, conserved [Leishmania tarentolae]
MAYCSTSRAKSPSHQQLYKAHTESTPRCTSSVTPTRNSFSLSVIPRVPSPHSSSRLMPTSANRGHSKSKRWEGMVHVADVNPTYSVAATVRCITPVNDRIMWTAEYSGTLCIRALPKGTPLKELPGREGSYCVSLLYLPSEDVVWAGFQDGYLHVYSAKNTYLLKEVMAHSGGLNCMIEVERSVFTGGGNWKVCQWNPTNCDAQLQRSLHGHSGSVRCFALYEGPTGAVIFSGSDDGTVRAWDPYESLPGQESSEANIHTFTGHSRAVLALAVVPHANQLWSAGEDLTLRVWDMRSLSCLAVCRGNHTAPISNLMVIESRVWSADKHGHILIWDSGTRSLLQDLSERLPYDDREKGMVLAMEKAQPITAYKVWTASSNGVLQCWNAETMPIIFDDVHVFAGAFKGASAKSAAPQFIAAGIENSATATPAVDSSADAACSTALTLSPSNNCRDTINSDMKDNLAVWAPTTQMQDYIHSLQDELEATKRDAKLNYEKYRMEAQCEIETQQLLAQENDRLRDLVHELQKRAGEPHNGFDSPVEVSQGTSSHHMMEMEVERLQSALIEAQRHLEKALERQFELEAELDRQKPAPSSLHIRSTPTPSNSTAQDLCQPFMRQDETAKRPNTADDACADSHLSRGTPSGPGNNSTNPLSAFLFTSCHDDGESAGHAGVPVEHTRLSRSFKGGNWRYIMEEKPHELRSTFIADFCAGIGVAPTQLERVDLSLGSLVAEVEVVHPASVPAAELQRRMQAYRFPALMRLHTDAFTAGKTLPDTAAATINDLQRQLETIKDQRRIESSPEPQKPSSNGNSSHTEGGRINSSEWERLKDQNSTLRDTLQRQVKLINDLKQESAEKDVKLTDTRARLQDAEKRLREAQEEAQDNTSNASRQRAHDATGAKGEHYNSDPPHLEATVYKEASELQQITELDAEPLARENTAAAGRMRLAPTPSGASDEEDHEALKRYVHEQLKPMISRLKQEKAELQVDNGNLKKRIGELNAQVQQQREAGREKKVPMPSVVASKASDEEVQNLREDHEALNNYLHDQLKPTISRLKREKGELEIDLSRAQEDLQKVFDMYDGAAAALEEEHVREEKMGEAMEALRKALEAEQLKHQTVRRADAAVATVPGSHAANSATCQGLEISSGRPTEPTQLRGWEDHGYESAEPLKLNAKKDPLDKLVALNLDLSVRLADAETVIVQLQNSLACSSSQMAEQQGEIQRLLNKIQQYQQSGEVSPVSSVAGRYSSVDNVVSSASPSKSPSRTRR